MPERERDLIDRLQSGRDALRRAQQSLARYTLTAEQRRALLDGMTHLATPGDQLQSIVDVMDAFGPPHAQIQALLDELAEQRRQVDALGERLAHIEGIAERLALASEQLAAFQEPFVRMASIFTGQEVERPNRARTAAPVGDEDEHDRHDDLDDPEDEL